MSSQHQIGTTPRSGDPLMRDGEKILAVKVSTAAHMLSVDRTTLYRWNKLGLIAMRKINGTTLIPMSEISRLLTADTSSPQDR